MCAIKKVTKETRRRGASLLRIGTLRSSARRGTVRELAALRHPHLFALAGPAVLGSLKADPTSNATAAPSRSTPRVDAVDLDLDLDLDLPVRLERAEHRRGIRGEEAPVSERSEFGAVP
ncbi:hypothetical protein [Stenotrophomonas maltophilia]|uniref:hypothetical protein n=1 Tax=Stenotrophomonas maltophilia TaxID=40324 RepID=UPI00117E5D3D|nr:hypothetical protein [Stenotrophomonas maltophilia]